MSHILMIAMLAIAWPMLASASDQRHDVDQHEKSAERHVAAAEQDRDQEGRHRKHSENDTREKKGHEKHHSSSTVKDTTPPIIQIQQPAITVEATSPTMVVDLGSVTATDAVDGAITPVSNAPAVFPIGVTTVTWTATDAAGNTATAQQLVTVQDTTPPAITAPAAVAADSTTGQPIAVAIGAATATDTFGSVTISNNAPAVFPIGITTVTWTATDANGNSATATQTVTVNDTSFLANLPPDPGPAGEATLAGIDSDNDGVRDDVQRWIALTYPNSQKTRAALSQYAKAMQSILLNAGDAASARTHALVLDRASDCTSYIRQQLLGIGGSDAYRIKRELEAVYLNTAERSRAWLQADSQMSGMFFNVPSNLSSGCDFNPNVLPN
jgi:HYR domain